MTFRPHILHLHSSFSPGGRALRAVRLMNTWGNRARHTIISGIEGQYGARDAIAGGVPYEIAQDPPPLTGKPSVARFEALANYMRRFDLVLTYDWGAIDGAMARRAFATRGLPPLIHHEDGFNADEAKRLKLERNLYRRIALSAAHALVVPSLALERIALATWKQPRERVHRIANGVPVGQYERRPKPNAIPGFKRKPDELVIGTIAGLRPVKNLSVLVTAFGGLGARARLVIVGEGAERDQIARVAANMGVADRVLMPGFLPEPHRYVGLFDIFALSSLSEQFPTAVVEAMAAGLPVASPMVGDVGTMVAAENRPYLARAGDAVRLRDSLENFVQSQALRRSVGSANRAKALAEYDEARMIAAYARLYGDALARPDIFA